MVKIKNIYVCNHCGAESPKWVGKCPVCGEWNTYQEEVIRTETAPLKASASGFHAPKSKPVTLAEIELSKEPRIVTGGGELDRVLGGGIVPGSLILLGGEPGIGKSTLILQTVLQIPNQKVLYVSGEESVGQLKLRASRISGDNPNAWFVSETSLEEIFEIGRAHV